VRSNSAFSIRAPELETITKPDDWNDLRISVIGKRYITHLNGTQMIDFTYPSPVATDGVIGLQLHSGGEGRMRFKDLRIRDLTDRIEKPAAPKIGLFDGLRKPSHVTSARSRQRFHFTDSG
jgi:hypothetical protein